ncbi:MAG TPA: response regulator, partial [Lacipirellulaceae bacterium]
MNGTVLLIEADQHDGKTVAEALGHEGFRLVVCAQPLDALRFVDASVDLVICDLATNRNRAFELLRLWRQRSKNPPFLFLVDGGDVQSAVDAMKVGASDCLTKPIESARLHQSVGQFLGKTNAAERFRPAEAA